MKGAAKVEGFAELDAALAELPKATGKNVLRRVARQALTPMREDARQRAPDDPKTPPPHDLKSSLEISEKQKTSRFSGLRLSASSITMSMGPTRYGYPQAMVQEFGSGPHYVSKNAGRARVKATLAHTARKMHPGNPAHPYMRPAWDAGAEPMLEFIKGALAVEIERARARLARKAERLAAKPKDR